MWTNVTVSWATSTPGVRRFRAHRNPTKNNMENKDWEGRLCGCSQDTKAYRIYNETTHKAVESRSTVLFKAPSKVVSPPITEPGKIDEMDNDGIISFHDEPEDDDMLQDVRGDTSRIDFNNDVTYNHTIPIVQPGDAAIAEKHIKIRGFNSSGYSALRISTGSIGGWLQWTATADGRRRRTETRAAGGGSG